MDTQSVQILPGHSLYCYSGDSWRRFQFSGSRKWELLNVTPRCVRRVSFLTIGSVSAWLLLVMSNNSSHREQKQPSLLPFPPLWFLEHLSHTLLACISNLHYLSSSIDLPALWEGIDFPLGREDVSPCTDWIDNAELNIALRQEAGEEDIFRNVYGATTRTLPQLHGQLEERGVGGGTKHCRILHLVGL